MIEQSLFEQLQTLKEVEESIVDSDESIARFRRTLDEQDRSAAAFGFIAVGVVILILVVLIASSR